MDIATEIKPVSYFKERKCGEERTTAVNQQGENMFKFFSNIGAVLSASIFAFC